MLHHTSKLSSYSQTKKWRRKFHILNWRSTPSKAMPHGLSGIISVLSGLFLILHSVVGNLHVYRANSPGLIILMIFVLSTSMNAIAGAKLLHLVPRKEAREVFKSCATMQLCLSFFVFRFAPIFCRLIQFLRKRYSNEEWSSVSCLVNIFDIGFTISILRTTLSFHRVAFDQWAIHQKKAFAIFISIGTCGIMLLSAYPIQLALFGQEWWDCVQSRYPEQSVGMVGYIYIPTTVTFSLVLFGATLYLRGLLSEKQYGIGSAFLISVCLFGTVMCQEIHIPFVSTQRIYLPCEEPVAGSNEALIVQYLDFSIYARRFLTSLLKMEFENK